MTFVAYLQRAKIPIQIDFGSGDIVTPAPSETDYPTLLGFPGPHLLAYSKTVQELMRHANSRLTLDVYAQALTPAKRAAHLKLVGLIHPAAETAIGPSWSHAEEAVAVSG